MDLSPASGLPATTEPGGGQLSPWGSGGETAKARVVAAVEQSQATATSRAYQSDWRRFTRWCALNDVPSLPAAPETVAAYLAEAADDTVSGHLYSPTTLRRWVSSINFFHRAANLPAPGGSQLVTSTVAGLHRAAAKDPRRRSRRREALRLADIDAMVAAARQTAVTWPQQLRERRDSALLWLAFAGAFRRSELAALRIEDVRPHRVDGLHLWVWVSKTDQEGAGQVKVAPFGRTHERCPVCAYRRWHQVVAAFDTGGRAAVIRELATAEPFTRHVCRGNGMSPMDGAAPVFRRIDKHGNVGTTPLSGAAIHTVIRDRARAAGFSDAEVERLGGHSPRAGFVTEALSQGASAHAIMRQTGHASPATVEIYARERTPAQNNAVTELGF
ncbi:tyrosine-type recombinase/integrase [Prescottella subtropica]|uniref:tyrosine-type recombinase/integrase n=1 Tax=Prescottella subtropica TaxID=2545757 RepID=UPI0010F97895|nr:tyrosine-type recombinase/integrase [Prescottella subtropica]